MAHYAPVAPPQLLRSLHNLSNHLVGRYHLLLAHDVFIHPKKYEHLLPAGSFVIMDNSMVELGKPVPWGVMEKALEVVPSQVVVLPDLYGDAKKTVELAQLAAKEWKIGKDQSFMAVPHGKNLEEYGWCAKQLAQVPRVKYFGCARTATKDFGSRKIPIDILCHTRLPERTYGAYIHLLGFSGNLEDDLECSRNQYVLGIDSAVPVRMGQNKKMMWLGQQDPGPREDFWERKHDFVEPETVYNMTMVRCWMQPNNGKFSPIVPPNQSHGHTMISDPGSGSGSQTAAATKSGRSE